MKAYLQPLGGKVLIRRDEADAKTRSGLLLPDVAKQQTDRGVIIAVGPGKLVEGQRRPVNVQVGERVLFARFSIDDVPHESETLVAVSEDAILARLED